MAIFSGASTRSTAAAEGSAAEAETSSAIDKAELALCLPRRLRDKAHRQYVATQPCLVCGRNPSQAHHLRFAQLRSLGSKVSDEFTVPVCALHHRAIHDTGSEEGWWKEAGIEPLKEAERLWRESHGQDADDGMDAEVVHTVPVAVAGQ